VVLYSTVERLFRRYPGRYGHPNLERSSLHFGRIGASSWLAQLERGTRQGVDDVVPNRREVRWVIEILV